MKRKFGIKTLINEYTLIVLAVFLVISFFAIHPYHPQGVYVSFTKEPASESVPSGVIVNKINDFKITNLSTYYHVLNNLPSNTVRVSYLEESIPYVYSEKVSYPFLVNLSEDPVNLGLVVIEVPETNLNFGLDIEGGTKVLLEPEERLLPEEIDNILGVLRERLNIYGLKEIPISYVQDLSGNQFFRLEFAGQSQEEVRELLEREGKFEARIGNTTVFTGEDILGVCITGVQCGLSLQPRVLRNSQGQETIYWEFSFQIDITEEAAKDFARATANLSSGECTAAGCYLNQTLDFYIDNKLLEGGSLNIGSSLRGEELTTASIQGTRPSKTEAQSEMRKMQAMLQARRMPITLNIVRAETISPSLGRAFLNNIFTVFIMAIIAVDLVIGLRYKTFRIILPIIFITLSEIFITIGVAGFIGWTLDLASIAGIIASVGTGINDQIVITDEVIRGGRKSGKYDTMKKRIKTAFFIVMACYAASVATMIPLIFASAGIIRGFAITTIIGISVGVFITRPAYARICEHILKKE